MSFASSFWGVPMPFRLPTFNVPVNVWRGAHFPPVGPPAIAGLLANISLGRRVLIGTDSQSAGNPGTGVGIDVMLRIMMVPAGTDLRGPNAVGFDPDLVEVPAGSGAFYLIIDVADMAKGFANEHRVAWFSPGGAAPLPVPLP